MVEELFVKQTEAYAKGRPSYPASLFEKLASLTERHELAWDVGTGNGQSAFMVAEHYKLVVATDVSEQQLAHAKPRSNIKYSKMSATPSLDELERIVGAEGSVDLVTVATALHWFDLDKFFPIVKRVLRKQGGVFAAWTYFKPRINPEVDKLTDAFYEATASYHLPQRQLAYDGYRNIPFPFEPLSGRHGVQMDTLEMESTTNLEGFLNLWKSSSTYQRALDEGRNFLNEDVIEALKRAWGGTPDQVLPMKNTIHLYIGTVTKPASAE